MSFVGFITRVVSLLLATASFQVPITATESETSTQVTCYQDVCQLAERLAAGNYAPPEVADDYLRGLSYDQYVTIHYDRKQAIWKGKENPFWLEGFHQGFVQQTQVQLHLIEQGTSKPVLYRKSQFRFGSKIEQDRIPENAGFAGLRVLSLTEDRKKHDEILTFLGASYFRARTDETVYGSSNRGLAVNIGMQQAEEFPIFRALWIVEPEQDANKLKVLALMDSPSLTGAYEFELDPGQRITIIDVQGMIFLRQVPEKLALAPLTSMWMWGDGIAPPPKDKRPHVHDADGLLIQGGNRWEWRTLSRQVYPSVMSFPIEAFKGYGLIQRETAEKFYQDSGALYHLRPSIWVEPVGAWPAGRVELLELPAVHEGIDSIGAYWVVEEQLSVNQPLKFAYRLHHFSGDYQEASREQLLKVVKTEVVRNPDKNQFEMIVFWKGGASEHSAAEKPPWNVQIQTVRGRVIEQQLTPAKDHRWKLSLLIEPENAEAPVEMKASLWDGQQQVSETWAGLWALQAPEYQIPQVYLRSE